MNSFFKTLIAGYGAKKLGGGCFSTILIFILIYFLLGQCNNQTTGKNLKPENATTTLHFSKPVPHTLTKIWQTDSVIDVPESVLFDNLSGMLFVSQIGGKSPTEKDGIGGISTIDTDGKVINQKWVTGLNAPKGLGRYKNNLYVADISEVVVIDIKTAKIIKRIPIENSVFLNDIAINSKGIVYVSDSYTKKVHQIIKGVPSVLFNNISGVNGLKSINNDLFIAGGKTFFKAGLDKKLVKLTEIPNDGDGVEPVGNGDFIVSSWPGYIYYVYADGKYDVLIDSHNEKINTADIGYDPIKKIVYVPTFFKNSIAAYQLN